MSKVGEDKDHQGAMISPEWRRFSVSGQWICHCKNSCNYMKIIGGKSCFVLIFLVTLQHETNDRKNDGRLPPAGGIGL